MDLSAFYHPVFKALGMALTHSLWQGAVIAVILLIILQLLKSYSANIRYWFSVMALALLFGWTVSTFLYYHEWSVPKTENAGTSGLVTDVLSQVLNYSTSSPLSGTTFSGRFYAYFEEALPYVISLWTVGVLFFILRLVFGLAGLRQLRTRGILPLPDTLQNKADLLIRKVCKDIPVRVLLSVRVHIPMVIGFIKPVILLPAGIITGLSPQQLEAVLIHELGHIRRNDFLVNILQNIIEALLFFNPFVWWVSNHIRQEREMHCDEIAIQFGSDRLEYAKTLSMLATIQHHRLAPALTGSSNQLLKRIQKLIKMETNKANTNRTVSALLLAGLLGIMVMTSFSVVQENKANEMPERLEISATATVPEPTDELVHNKDVSIKLSALPPSPVELLIREKATASIDTLSPEEEELLRDEMENTRKEVEELTEEFTREFNEKFEEYWQQNQIDINETLKEALVEIEKAIAHIDLKKIHFEGLTEEEKSRLLDEWNFNYSREDLKKALQDIEIAQEEILIDLEEELDQVKLLQEKELETLEKHMVQTKEMVETIQRKAFETQKKALKVQQQALKDLEKIKEKKQAFDKEITEEFRKDGYLKDNEKLEELKISDEDIRINGQKAKSRHREKYRKIIEDYWGNQNEFNYRQ